MKTHKPYTPEVFPASFPLSLPTIHFQILVAVKLWGCNPIVGSFLLAKSFDKQMRPKTWISGVKLKKLGKKTQKRQVFCGSIF